MILRRAVAVVAGVPAGDFSALSLTSFRAGFSAPKEAPIDRGKLQ